MRDHIRPLYAKNFHCIGGKCEDNCCHGWDVSIDRETYEKYQTNPVLRIALQESSALSSRPTEATFAIFKPTASSNCPMLLADGLCRIHKEHGESNLPKTCSNYPRTTKRIDGLFENALVLSCPEAARLVLLDPELLPRKIGAAENGKYTGLLTLEDDSTPASEKPMRYFWEGREFSLALVQDRQYPLWQRLFLLGIFCKRLDAVMTDPRGGSVARLLREYAEIAAQGKLRPAMDGIPARPEAQLMMILQVVGFHLNSLDPRFTRFRECLRDFLRGAGHPDCAQKLDAADSQTPVMITLDTCLRHYVEAHDRYYAPFMERHPSLLENYLINHILRMAFPFRCDSQGESIGPQQQFLLMCLEFAVIKGLLIGMAGHYGESFAAEHVVKLVQVVAKSIEHSGGFLRALNWKGLADSNSLAALLKN
jgi:lysine-N-methylase